MGESACKCVHLASKNLPCVPVSLKAKLCGGVTLCRSNNFIHSNVLTTLSPFLTHMHLYLLHTHEVSPQFEKVSWTTMDFKVKMQSVTVLCGDIWSWVGVHLITHVNIAIEIYSMPKLNPPIFRTPLIYHWVIGNC